jgi:hypothetical protein
VSSWPFAGACLALTALGLSIAGPAGAQVDSARVCDADISRAAQPQSYRWRGDRCEGTYARRVSAGLRLHAIYQSFDSFDVQSNRDPLLVEWDRTAGDPQPLHLRADGRIGDRIFYRMDAVVPPDSSTFAWNTVNLRSLSAGDSPPTRDALSVRGWTSLPAAEGRPAVDTVYVPLRIRQNVEDDDDAGARCAPVKLVLWATSRPDSVFVGVARVEGNSMTDVRRREVGRLTYPLDSPLEIELPEVAEPGLYVVAVSARLGGESWSAQYRLTTSGPPTGCG